MKNTSNIIKTDGGNFIINHFGNDFKIENFDLFREGTILMVDYISDSSVINDDSRINGLFNKFDIQIIQLLKSIINENIDFYKHFNIDLNMPTSLHTSVEKPIKYYKIFKTELV